MNNSPDTRTQWDQRQLEFSLASAMDYTNSEDMTRQEFKEETDINTILKKFGVGQGPQLLPIQNGEVDYDVGFQDAFLVAQDAQRAWNRMSPDLRAKYPTWQLLLDAVAKGEDPFKTEDTPKPEEKPADSTPAT